MRQRAYVKISLKQTENLGRESCSSRRWKGKVVSFIKLSTSKYTELTLHRLRQYQK